MNAFIKHILMTVVLFCAVGLVGCAEQNKVTTDAQIKDAATNALRDLQWPEDAIVIDSIEKHGDRWHVFAHRLPPTPGAHATVLLSESGKLIEVIRGK